MAHRHRPPPLRRRAAPACSRRRRRAGRAPPRRRRRRRSARTSCASCPSRRRDRLRPGAGRATSTRPRHRAHLRGAARLRPAGACRSGCVPLHRRGDARGVSADFTDLDGAPAAAASSSPTTRRSRASRASWSPHDYVYAFKRFYDPAVKSPSYSSLDEDGILGLEALRAARPERQEAVRLRRRGRGPARARPLHAAVPAGEPRPRFTATLAASRTPSVAREVVEAYGDDIDGASGRHRAVSLQVMAAQLAHRARTQSRPTARCATTASPPPTTPRAGLSPGASTAGACR